MHPETECLAAEFDYYAPAYQNLLQDPIRDRFAAGSEYFHHRKASLIEDFLCKQSMVASKAAWLDVGCGTGELLKIAGSRFADAVGCDPSARMMEACAGVRVLEQPSPINLPFPDASFDFVTAVCVYHHVQPIQRGALTASIHRVLKPGGVFCLIEHNPFNPITQLIVSRCPVDVDAELISPQHARRLMDLANFEPIETTYFLYLPEALFKRIGIVERCLGKLPLGGQFAMFSRRQE